jgi:hypothetical protein
MSTGFNSPVKRYPYSPYTGSTIAEVARSFHNVNRTSEKGSFSMYEFSRLMRHINGK